MNSIVLTFLTKKGEEAYRMVEKEGKKQSWRDRQIGKRVATDNVISKNPLIVKIDVKVDWLAVRVELDKQIALGLKNHGADIDKDYTMEVQ